MVQYLYQTLADYGYHHPVHPVFVHLTIGMVIGSLIFIMLAWLANSNIMAQTAKNCMVLAIVSIVPTAMIGYADWQYFFAGAWIVPFRWKIILTAALFTVLIIAWLSVRNAEKINFGHVFICFICFAIVSTIGYFGAELVYGKKIISKKEPSKELVEKGAELFARSCSLCHFTETKGTKIGPGLKGIFKEKNFPVSQWPAERESFEKQLKTPFKNMPAFGELEGEQIDALMAYLKSL